MDGRHLIIGAGPTGLGAAWQLATFGSTDWCLCEAGTTFGGLAGSHVDAEGFTWDYGGHVQHSHYAYFDTLMDDLLGQDGWLSHERSAWVWLDGRFVPYPFQLNLHRLSEEMRDECVAGLRAVVNAPREDPPKDFGNWIERSFGRGIARVFMRPYNLKAWARPLDEMGYRWVGDRVAMVDLDEVLANIACRQDDTGWGPNRTFRYPRHGGTGAVWTALGDWLRRAHPASLRTGHRLVHVDTRNRVATFANGEAIAYGRLLTTMPLDEFVALTDLGDELGRAAAELRYTSTHVIGVGLHGAPSGELLDKSWMYFPGDDCPFYRVTVLSRYSPFNVPDASRFWSLLVEVSESSVCPRDQETVVEDTLQGLLATRLIASRNQVHHVWHRRLERGYPVPTTTRDEALAAILPALESRDVFSRGRFGAWKYEVSNQDHSLAQGVEVVERWFRGAPEPTLYGSHKNFV